MHGLPRVFRDRVKPATITTRTARTPRTEVSYTSVFYKFHILYLESRLIPSIYAIGIGQDLFLMDFCFDEERSADSVNMR